MKKTLLTCFAALVAAIVYAAPTVITEQPEGELRSYQRSGTSYQNFWGFWEGEQDGNSTQLVFAADGKTVYWKDPLTEYVNDSWIKGEISDDGTKIVFPAGQYLWYDETREYGYQLYFIKDVVLDSYGWKYESFTADKTTPITLTVDGNTLTLEGTDAETMTIIASITDDDEPAWNYYGDAQTVLTRFEATPVTAPEDLVTSTYMLSYGNSTKRIVNLGISGNEWYVQGIYTGLPEAWLKGTIEGNVVTVNSGQYMGDSNGTMLYWVAATAKEEPAVDNWGLEYTKVTYTYADKITFRLDPETGAYSGDIYLVASNSGTEVVRYGTYASPVLTPYVEAPATPADPEITDYYIPEDEDDDEEAYVEFYIYPQDVNGKDINPDNIYYRLYIDDDRLFTLSTADYEELAEDMSEFSYAFTDDWDFYVNTSTGEHSIYLYSSFERIGVQVIYRSCGEEHASNIVYSDGTKTTSVAGVRAAEGAVRTEYFDLSGRRVSGMLPGQIVIRRMTDARGVTTSEKVLDK